MPNWKKIIVSGSDAVLNTVTAVAFTGSLLGTASYTTTALSASYAPGGAAFPYTGSAIITGSLIVTGSITSSRDILVNGATVGVGKGNNVYNTVVGGDALFSANGADSDTAIGYQSLYSTTNGYNNTGVGTFSLFGNVIGIYNTGIGYGAGNNVTGDYNIAIGPETFNQNTGGSNRVAIGYRAQYQGSGNNNTSIGHNTLYSLTTGTGNVAVGYQAGYNETTSNKLYIANSSTSTPLIGGDFANARLGINIAPASTTATLHIKGSGTTSSTTSLLIQNSTPDTILSVNDDKNIGILTTTPGAALDIAQSGVGGNYNALFLRAGNSATTSGSNQISFGYSAQTNYAHAIKTRHQSANAIDNAIDFHTWKYGDTAATAAGQYVMTIAGTGAVGIGTKAPAYTLDVSGSSRVTSALTVGNVTGTPSTENTINVYPPSAGGTGEGGQILLAASGGLYTSASMLDTWQNQFRILKGTNTGGSTAAYLYMNLDNGNTQFTGAVTASAYSGLPNDYLYVTRNTNQTIGSGNWANRDVIFNNSVVSKGISYNTGTGLATLTAGKVYRITARIAWNAAGLYTFQHSCYDNLNNQLGPIAEMVQSPNGTFNISDGALDFIYAPIATIDVKIRTTNNVTALTGEYIRGDLNTQLIIQQIA